ncbi:farnesyl pyrophosphate synthase 1-like [Chenopodium quinoa]|uniref:farnesyl pyrophosphate synthase 1-like n=1 Tax=Chenopodium quinoa TaxID=63459 RepID=UPI000B785B0B|nr:farnesyl pyrophosphate synthase 1-like [Chenopodium quinoa]
MGTLQIQLVGCLLVLEDIMDNSHTRRGQPCWFRLPKVGMIAVNDGILLWNHINRIIRKHFRDQSYYVDLLELFNEGLFQTACGEMIDLIDTVGEEKDLLKYTLALQRRISKYKTAYGTFYTPFACALLMPGKKLDDYNDVKDILLEMGIYFQVQDDYLDCFGDPEMIGKIEEFKCSWLVVKALEVCNEEQKKLLRDNYGKSDPANVDAVKCLYKDLNLQGIFAEYEIEMYEKLTTRIEALPSKSVQSMLKSYLGKMFKRQK